MDKKGKGMEITGAGLFVIALIIGGIWYGYSINWGQPMVAGATGGATGGGTGGGTINVINTNPADTVSLSFTVIDKNLKEKGINTTYKNATVYFAVKEPETTDYKVSPTITVPSTSSGATKTGIAVGSSVKWFATAIAVNRNTTYTEAGEINDIKSSRNVEVLVSRHPNGCAGLDLKVYDENANAFVGTTCATGNQSVNVSSIALTAGGASKSYEYKLQLNDPYSQFGSTGILIGCDSVTTAKYSLGSAMTEIKSLPSLAQTFNIKKLYQSNVVAVRSYEGLISLGKISFQLNAGQTASDPITCWVFDKAKFLKVNLVDVSDDINDDTVDYKSVGSTDPFVQFTA